MTDPRWEWFDSITGAVLGAFAAVATVFGWFNGRIKETNARIDMLEKITSTHSASVLVQEAHHQANLSRLCRIEDSIGTLDEKQDKQLSLLVQMAKRA